MECPASLDEYEKLVFRMSTPRVVIDNAACPNANRVMCNVVESKVWTHDGRIAAIIFLKDCDSGSAIEGSRKIDRIEAQLMQVLKGVNDIRSAKTSDSMAVTHSERRLHQMMFADPDYERKPEFFIRHTDGTPINSDAEKQRVVLCIHAAIERRESEGTRLELCTSDKQGVLADVMRTLRENGLNVERAEISTSDDGTTHNAFYVTAPGGNPADPKTINAVRQKIGWSDLEVKEQPWPTHRRQVVESDRPTVGVGGAMLLSLGGILRRNL